KDKGLIVIGMDVVEEDSDQVAKFVKGKGGKMSYRIAFDGRQAPISPDATQPSATLERREGPMVKNWLRPSGADRIPYAFVVRENNIAWLGELAELETPLVQSMLDGTYDPKKVLEERKEREEAGAKLRALFPQFEAQMKDEKWDEALATADKIEKIIPAKDRKMVGANLRSELCLRKKDFEEAAKQLVLMSESQPDNIELQNHVAWQIVTDKRIKKPDLELAEKCASRANTLAQGEHVGVLDTLARVRFLQGKKDEAIKLMEEAMAKVQVKGMKDYFAKALESYKKDELPALPEQQE
ncbi:MAG: hypothetical protein ABSE73_11740, partial [Planctomycetota bacterium]